MEKTNEYKQLEERTYNSNASKEDRESARLNLANKFPEDALNIFVRNGDEAGLEYLSRSEQTPVQIRRNAYLEGGIQVSTEDLMRGITPKDNTKTFRDGRYRREALAEQDETDPNYKKVKTERKIAREFRKEVGLSEKEFQAWLTQKRPITRWAGYSRYVNRDGEEMSPLQEVAYKAYEN